MCVIVERVGTFRPTTGGLGGIKPIVRITTITEGPGDLDVLTAEVKTVSWAWYHEIADDTRPSRRLRHGVDMFHMVSRV